MNHEGVEAARVQHTLDAGGALIWRPLEGDLWARFPDGADHRRWLLTACRVRDPYKVDGGRWRLPRTSIDKVIRASLDEFGVVGLLIDAATLSSCTAACWNAVSMDCVCGCLGENHGQGGPAQRWVEIANTVIVRDDPRRLFREITPGVNHQPMKRYAGELETTRYTDNFRERDKNGWPVASGFVCESCGSRRAQVWDHCHTHGRVRAPLCTPCNTWHWQGHAVPPRQTRECDLSYYDYCPGRFRRNCSP